MRLFLVLASQAITLNIINYFMEQNYLLSVLLVMGGLSLTIAISTFTSKAVFPNDIKALVAFIGFSNIMTLIVEYFMLKYDVWAFSKQFSELSGFVFMHAPIEEFVYWFLCPVLVGGTYLNILRSSPPAVVSTSVIVRWIEKLQAMNIKARTPSPDIQYTETNAQGQYRRGGKYPVYLYLQLSIIAAIIAMLRYFHGSWKAVGYTTALFVIVAFPHEYYSVGQGFWIYNANHELGWFFMRVPLEGWLMYVISPVCGCMMYDIGARVFFKSK